MAAFTSVNVNVADGIASAVVGALQPLKFNTRYDVWVLARDFSLLVNVQPAAAKVSATTKPCVPCGTGFREVVACTSTSEAVCQRQGTRTCSAGWVFSGGSLCYALDATPSSVAQAAATCAGRSGALGVAYTSQDMIALAELCASLPPSIDGCWVGAAVHTALQPPQWTSQFSVTTPSDARVPAIAGIASTPLAPMCVYVARATGLWQLDVCSTPRAVVCATAATTGVRSAVQELACS